jgi:hypothetical protein
MRAYEFIIENFFFDKNYYEKNDCISIINNIKNELINIIYYIKLYNTTRQRLDLKNIPNINELFFNQIKLKIPSLQQQLTEDKNFKYAEFIIEKLTNLKKEFSTDMAYFKIAIENKRFNENHEIIKKLYKLIQPVDTTLQLMIDRIANIARLEKDI